MALPVIAGGFATVAGFAIAAVGWLVVDIGLGGYGYGPLPFVKMPTDWVLVLIGLGMLAGGSLVCIGGLTVLGVA